MAETDGLYINYVLENDEYMSIELIEYEDVDENSRKVYYEAKNGPDIPIYVTFSQKDLGHVKFEFFQDEVTFSPEQEDDAVRLCNKMNNSYRRARFYVDMLADGMWCVCADAFTVRGSVGPICSEMVKHIGRIVEDVYPEFKKAIYG